MKSFYKICLILLCISFYNCNFNKEENKKPPLVDGILREENFKYLDKYVGKSIADLLNDKRFCGYSKISVIDDPTCWAVSLMVYYESRCGLEVVPTEFNHMERLGPLGKWDIEKFKLETIGRISVHDSTDVNIIYKTPYANTYPNQQGN